MLDKVEYWLELCDDDLKIEGRYPEYKERISALLTKQYCEQLLVETEGFVCWIKKQLEKSQKNIQSE